MAVFNSLYAGQYDQLYAEKDYQLECDLVEKAFDRHADKKLETVLDVGCGTGGHSIELASRGHRVTGVDISAPMLEHAREKARSTGLGDPPMFIHGDARSFDSRDVHDVCIMMFAVVGYLTSNEDVISGLRNIRRQVRDGGLFICDFWYGPSVLSVRPGDRVRELSIPGGRVLRTATTVLDTSLHTADVTFRLWSLQADRLVAETTETHRMRYFFPQEFGFFLSQAGFALRSLSAFPSLEAPITDQSWNAVAVAQAV